MNKHQFKGFSDELQKIAVDPVTVAGLIAGGKMLGQNVMLRHGLKFAPARRLASEVMGAGVRSGAAGNPLPSRLAREAASLGFEPQLVGAFEKAHTMGRLGGVEGAGVAQRLARHPDVQMMLGPYTGEVLRDVPMMADTPLRKAIDYGLKPVGEVGEDISNAIRTRFGKTKRVTPRVVPKREIVSAVKPARTPSMSGAKATAAKVGVK
jgi:hypothetical protein